ncbi:MAG: BatD family protein [Tannerella sp.]|jgi:hypothetical protein|nr:BatD family protein [Tannerella sp.]
MDRKYFYLFVLMLLLIGGQSKAADVEFKAIAPEAVVMGEQFRLVFSINTEGGREFRSPDLSDFDVLIGPSPSTSTSIQYFNGQATKIYSQSYTYILVPKKEGTFNLAPASITLNNSSYSSNPLIIRVLPPDQTPNPATQQGNTNNQGSSSAINNDEIFCQILIPVRSVFEQEGLLVTFKLYSTVEAVPTNYAFPDFDGFLVRDIELNPQWVPEHYNGRNYRTAIIKQAILYPQRSGRITISSGKIEMTVRQRIQRQARSIFDDFFDSYQDVKKEVVTQSVPIDVKPLPPGKPASFNGAVGNYSMKTSINSTKVKANEAITITVALTGNGNIRLLKNPAVVFPNDFDAFDPKTEDNIRTTAQGTSGTKTFEFMAIPRYAGDFEIPAIHFSYFDPKEGVYKSLSSESFKILVEKGIGGEGTPPVVSNFSNQESIKYLGQDIRYIMVETKPRFILNHEMFFGSFTYIIAYLIITVLFIAFFMIYRKQVIENANIALVRTKKANKTAVRRLKNADKLLKESNKEAFYEEVLRAVWGYLSDKLSISQAQLTKDNVAAELSKYGVGEELSDEFIDILNTCEFARYAPGQGSEAMDSLFKQTVNAIGKMENTIKRNN